MHDGAIVFKTKIDNSDVQKDLDRVKRDIDKSQKAISEAETAKLPLVKQAEQLKAKLQEARQELAFFKDEQSAAQMAMQPGAALPDYMAANARLPALNAAVSENRKKVDLLEKEWLQVNGKVKQYNVKINKAKAALTTQQAKAAQLSKQLAAGGTGMAVATAKAQAALKKFQMRLGVILKQVLVFSMVIKALSAVVTYMGKALKSNQKFTSELAKLKGALLTAFQPIYEFLVPVLIALMRIATHVVTAVAKVAALLGGNSVSQYAKNAKALYEEANAIKETGEEAKKAQRSLAGFDEINQLSNNSQESDPATQEGTTPDFSAFDTGAIKEQVDELTLFLSGALLLIGMILTLSGASIPLGLGLMAVGAIGLASEIAADWESVKKIISEQTGLILAISSILLIIGMILAFTGAAIPLGVGLMVAGAAGFATAVAVDWESVKKEIDNQAGLIMAISSILLIVGMILAFTGASLPLGIGLMVVGAAGLATTAAVSWDSVKKVLEEQAGLIAGISALLLVVGIILCFTGVFPLGIGLIVVGAAGLITEAVVNWDSVKGPLTTALASLLAIVSGASIVIGLLLCLSGAGLGIGLALIATGIAGSVVAWNTSDNPITRFLKNMVNGIIGLVNMLIDAINSLFHIRFNGLKIGGVEIIPKIDTRLLNIPKIPMLAQGAVIPPNQEFMAILGDQKHGTNIEAPLSTIQEAVATVMAEYESSNLAGHEATVEMLREILAAVLGIEVGDTTIGQAANRYNEKMAIVRGRV